MRDDKRFAAISASLRRKGFRLRSINTARGNPHAPVLILIEEATRREIGRV
ncbi:hypothetical protein [Mesorhizobium sp. B2-4-6]|uniref:hypothetical protein n=1 Tax=Mesorhizobium sp. B2-4-6 TaxID=2589943 RepID=UPI0015E26FDB|nr:hypothetical protein [Mesorhizobium sp. B2-4-6]